MTTTWPAGPPRAESELAIGGIENMGKDLPWIAHANLDVVPIPDSRARIQFRAFDEKATDAVLPEISAMPKPVVIVFALVKFRSGCDHFLRD